MWTGEGFGFEATDFVVEDFEADGLAGEDFEAVDFAGDGFEATDGEAPGDFTGPFLTAACDTSVINTATAVKTAYAIILIRIAPPLFALTDTHYIMSGDIKGNGKIIFSAARCPQSQGRLDGISRPSCKIPKSCGSQW